MSNESILVVDDDEDIRIFIRTSLEAKGYTVIEAPDGDTALSICADSEPAVIILDLGLGQPDGLEVCRRLRQSSNVPIIMLTSHTEEIDEAMCLAAGADDYVTKPVSGRIITLRVATQLRRAAIKVISNDAPVITEAQNTLSHESIEMDVLAREVRVNSAIISLTVTEFEILKLLMENPRQVFTRDQFAPILGATLNFGLDHALDTHASRLRAKIRKAGGPDVVISVRRVGYRLSAPK